MGDEETKFRLLLNRIDFEFPLSKIAVIMMAVRSKGHVCLLVIWENRKRSKKYQHYKMMMTMMMREGSKDHRQLLERSKAPQALLSKEVSRHQ